MNKRSKTITFTILILCLAAAFAASLCIGRYKIGPSQIHDIISGTASDVVRNVFYTLRLPRTIVAVLAGMGLGLAGFVYQSLFKNPLASPDIIGVARGANAGAAIGILTVAGAGSYLISLFSFVGGIIAALAALGLAGLSKRRSLASVVLSGIVISSVSEAVIMTLKLFADPESELAPLEFWAMGGLSAVTGTKLISMLPGFMLGLLILFALRYKITLLSLSDDEAAALGVRVPLMRTVILIAATMIVSSVVSVTGLISFIGLIAPHCARMLSRRNNMYTAVLSAIIGGIIIVAADCVARVATTGEIPISIITSLIGAPFLVFLMVRKKVASFY